jgi:hypothetical protein
MSNLQAIADRFEIEALRGEFTDALMMRDYDRFASLSRERCGGACSVCSSKKAISACRSPNV